MIQKIYYLKKINLMTDFHQTFLAKIFRWINHCCVIDNILFTDQYKTKPAAKPPRINVKTNGKNANILAWVGSAGAGLSFCCNHIVKPIIMGRMPTLTIDKIEGTFQDIKPNNVRMPSGSGADKSWIHP